MISFVQLVPFIYRQNLLQRNTLIFENPEVSNKLLTSNRIEQSIF